MLLSEIYEENSDGSFSLTVSEEHTETALYTRSPAQIPQEVQI